jgi:hypothetical protein
VRVEPGNINSNLSGEEFRTSSCHNNSYDSCKPTDEHCNFLGFSTDYVKLIHVSWFLQVVLDWLAAGKALPMPK